MIKQKKVPNVIFSCSNDTEQITIFDDDYGYVEAGYPKLSALDALRCLSELGYIELEVVK